MVLQYLQLVYDVSELTPHNWLKGHHFLLEENDNPDSVLIFHEKKLVDFVLKRVHSTMPDIVAVILSTPNHLDPYQYIVHDMSHNF